MFSILRLCTCEPVLPWLADGTFFFFEVTLVYNIVWFSGVRHHSSTSVRTALRSVNTEQCASPGRKTQVQIPGVRGAREPARAPQSHGAC